ncbi:MAG: hypothetical protein AMJ90_04390 [candidate division Zixibacteria bacterium SM23_73_2]|nr:MAG: hypothetical protein AMJ90_04390 [candidate division Zixibacteria bacterium SM23_73_2]
MGNKKKEKHSTEEERYRYIGFDVFPGKAGKFWKSEEEEKSYLEKVKKKKKALAREGREHSMVYMDIISKFERILLTFFSALLVLTFFIPWFSLEKAGQAVSYTPLGYILDFAMLTNFASLGGFLPALLAFLLLFYIILSLLSGIGNLIFLYRKVKPFEKYLRSLKRMLFFNYIPVLFWIAAMAISIIGFSTPLGSTLGIKELSESFNVINFVTATSFGIWIALACLLVNAVKASDL